MSERQLFDSNVLRDQALFTLIALKNRRNEGCSIKCMNSAADWSLC